MRSQHTHTHFETNFLSFRLKETLAAVVAPQIPEDLMQRGTSPPRDGRLPTCTSPPLTEKPPWPFLNPHLVSFPFYPPLSSSPFSLHLSIPSPCGNRGPPISPQATVNVWHGGAGSQSPQKPAVSMQDAHSEIIRTFIHVKEHRSVGGLLRQVFL